MAAVSCIDHCCFGMTGGQKWGAGTGMADNDDVGIHGVEVFNGVNQGLAFDGAAARSRDIEGIAAHPFPGKLEGKSCAGAGFKEQVDYGFTPQGRDLLDGSAGNFLERLGSAKNEADIIRRQVCNCQDMPVSELIIVVRSLGKHYSLPVFPNCIGKINFKGRTLYLYIGSVALVQSWRGGLKNLTATYNFCW